jgi:CheY-like chemotaxis protein
LSERKKDNGNATQEKAEQKFPDWKILVVDDEPDIHTMTRLALKNFEFSGKRLQIFQAMSGIEAREILATESNIAVALIDVVMETDDAGLQLIKFIRNELKKSLIRLIIRTGQPGMAPEKEVIERYDIDDYKEKTELTAQKLYTTMRVALKSYHELTTLDNNRKVLKKILDVAPQLYRLQSLKPFFNKVLTQMISLCNQGTNTTVSNGFVVSLGDKKIIIQSVAGSFAKPEKNLELEAIAKICLFSLLGKPSKEQLSPDALFIPLKVQKKPIGFVYLEDAQHLSKDNQDMIHIMAHQCASALENIQLYLELQQANKKTLELLATAENAAEKNVRSLKEIYKLAVPPLY